MIRLATLTNVTTDEVLSTTVRYAATAAERLVGALRERALAPGDGIWLEPCSAIHTFGMRATIDVILLDARRTVLALRPGIKPNRPLVGHRRARAVVEMGAGFLRTARIAVGDRLHLVDSRLPADARE